VYTLIGDTIRPEHDTASMQVLAEGCRSRQVCLDSRCAARRFSPSRLRAAMIEGGE